jgi:hypothetical protein
VENCGFVGFLGVLADGGVAVGWSGWGGESRELASNTNRGSTTAWKITTLY